MQARRVRLLGRSVSLRLLIAIAVTVGLLIIARAALPWLVKDYINRRLAEIPDYHGQVADVDLALILGRARIQGLEIVKQNGQIPIPFVSVPEVVGSIEWRSILEGRIDVKADVVRPSLNVVAGPNEAQSQTSISRQWIERMRQLIPFKASAIRIEDASVHFKNLHSTPQVDVYLSDLDVTAENLTNIRDVTENTFAHVTATGRAMSEAPLVLNLRLDPLAPSPTFDLDAQLTNLSMVKLNDLLSAYGRIDVKQGSGSFYIELAARDGRFKGYVKPIFENLDVLQRKDVEKGPLHFIWEALVAGLGRVLTSEKPEDQVAAHIPLSGRIEHPEAGVIPTVVSLLQNAFVQALSRGLDQSISLGSTPPKP